MQARHFISMKKFLLRLLLVFAILLVVLSLALAVLGYMGAGWEGVKSGLLWGLLFAFMALPALGWLVSARYWSDFAGRWGASRFKDGDDSEHHD